MCLLVFFLLLQVGNDLLTLNRVSRFGISEMLGTKFRDNKLKCGPYCQRLLSYELCNQRIRYSTDQNMRQQMIWRGVRLHA